MPEPTKPGEEPKGAPAQAPAKGGQTPATPEPAKPAQPKPAEPGVSPEPGGVKPEPQSVPIGALLDERGKRQALEAELTMLRQQQMQFQQPQPYQPQQPFAAPQNDIKAQIDRLWETDPRQAVESQIMLSIDWYDRVNNTIDAQADMLAAKYPDFNNHRTAATRYVRSLPANQRGVPGMLESAYFYVKGQNVDSIIKSHEEELLRKYQSGEFVSQQPGAMGAPAPQPGGVQLTDEQRAVASAMGMTDEQYAMNIKSTSGAR